MKFLTSVKHLVEMRQNRRLAGGSATTVEVTERYARRVLHLKESEPMVYQGLRLYCIGSKKWRRMQAGATGPSYERKTVRMRVVRMEYLPSDQVRIPPRGNRMLYLACGHTTFRRGSRHVPVLARCFECEKEGVQI